MPRLGMTKKTYRDCLVCGTLTNTAHMGIDVCRACTVFYRRSNEKRKPYACRSGTSRCTTGKGLNCKRCRLYHIEHVLKESGAKDDDSHQVPQHVNDVPLTYATEDVSMIPVEQTLYFEPAHPLLPNKRLDGHNRDYLRELRNFLQGPFDSAPVDYCNNNDGSGIALLSRVKIAYDKLCFGRLMGEQFGRKEPPSPRQICSINHPVYPATYATMNQANRVLMSCILDFGATAFPEFGKLSDDEQAKWTIATKFFYTFRMLDHSFRAKKRFADVPNRNFGGYTLYLSEDIVEHFFDDFDNEKGNVEEAKKIMKKVCSDKPRRGRAILEKMHPDDQEFRALLVLMFWATNGMGVRDEISRISDGYQQQVSSELHQYYRDVLHLDDYATRMGELYSCLPLFEAHDRIKETFQVFRLLDIFSDDSFTYKLTQT